MSLACRAPDCPRTPHLEEAVCYLHLEEDGKARAPLLACLAEQAERGVIRMDGVHLVGADLSDMTLSLRHFRNSDLRRADFTNVRLSRIGCDGSVLDDIVLEDAILEKVDLRRVRSMSGGRTFGAIFKDVFLPAGGLHGSRCAYDAEGDRDPYKAESVYRNLKETYEHQGEHETSGVCYEREMDMRRLRSRGLDRFWLSALWLSCGYGERPRRAIVTSFIVILGYARAFMALDRRGPDALVGADFMQCACLSTVTFTTLGYGDIIPLGVGRYIAATEAFLGAWMMALFVFVFCRRLVR